MEDTYKGQVDNPLSLKRYVYTANNPLMYIDPTGNSYEIGGPTSGYMPGIGLSLSHESTLELWERYRKYGPNAVADEYRPLAEMVDFSPCAGGIKIVRGVSKAVITAVNSAMVAQRAANIANVGDKIGNLGTLVKNPGIKVNWESARQHALNRMSQKGVTSDIFDSWVKNGKAIMQDENTYLFLTKEGVAVVSKEGIPQTAYKAEYFKEHIKNALQQVFGD